MLTGWRTEGDMVVIGDVPGGGTDLVSIVVGAERYTLRWRVEKEDGKETDVDSKPTGFHLTTSYMRAVPLHRSPEGLLGSSGP